jgi:hypothetical protein
MKTVSLDSRQVSLPRLLSQARKGGVIFLTQGGNTRYVLAKADESDREICALRSDARFMAHLSDLEARARRGKPRALKEVRERLLTRGPSPR